MDHDLQSKKFRLKYEKDQRKRRLLEKDVRTTSAALEKLRELFCIPEEARASGLEVIRTPEGWLYKEKDSDRN